MTDEFDDLVEPALMRHGRPPALLPERLPEVPVARLVSRLYRSAEPTLRARLLACLLRPLGSLGLVAVAAGAFADFVQRRGAAGATSAISDVARFSEQQVAELANFVEQVSPQALYEFAKLVTDSPLGMVAFSASAAMLLMRSLQHKGAVTLPPSQGPAGVSGM